MTEGGVGGGHGSTCIDTFQSRAALELDEGG